MWLISVWPVGGNLPFELKPGEFTIGRALKNPITIWDSSISKTHAKLTVNAKGGAKIEDLGSRNGIDVNGKLTASSEVHLRDRIRLGGVPCLILPEPLPHSMAAQEPSASGDSNDSFDMRLRFDAVLSPPQKEVLALLVQGLAEAEVAKKSGRSYHTVHNHVRVIYKQFGVHSRSELLAKLSGHR